MIALWIVLAIILGLALLILLGGASIRIVCREKLRVVASICGIRITLVSDKTPKPKEVKDLTECDDPDKALLRELRRQIKEARRAEKRRENAKKKAAQKAVQKKQKAITHPVPTTNLKEKMDMILSLVKKLYEVTRGKIRIRVQRMHIKVGTDDAAKTAILYGVIVQSAASLLNLIEYKFTPIKREDGEMQIEPDYLSGKCAADIDITCSIKFRHVIAIAVAMLKAFFKEKERATEKATRRYKRELRQRYSASK